MLLYSRFVLFSASYEATAKKSLNLPGFAELKNADLSHKNSRGD